MRTDLRSLELLIAVAERGSIGAAGRALGLRQPSATDRLQRLERQLGVALFDRSPRGTTLTVVGSTVADWAREVLASSDRLEAGVQALRTSGGRRLRVSASMTIAEYLMPRWLPVLRTRSPGTSVALRVCNSEQVADDVLTGKADVGFVENRGHVPGLRQRRVASDRLVLIVPPGHRWARRRLPVSPAELASAALVLREPGSGTRQALDQALEQLGLTIEPALELGSTAAVKAAVDSGQGVSVLSELAVRDDVAIGRLVVAPLDLDLRRDLRLVWRQGSTLMGAAAELEEIATASASRAAPS